MPRLKHISIGKSSMSPKNIPALKLSPQPVNNLGSSILIQSIE